jgi:hypothetical protein
MRIAAQQIMLWSNWLMQLVVPFPGRLTGLDQTLSDARGSL